LYQVVGPGNKKRVHYLLVLHSWPVTDGVDIRKRKNLLYQRWF